MVLIAKLNFCEKFTEHKAKSSLYKQFEKKPACYQSRLVSTRDSRVCVFVYSKLYLNSEVVQVLFTTAYCAVTHTSMIMNYCFSTLYVCLSPFC